MLLALLKAELPYLKHPSNIDAHGKPLRGPPVNSSRVCGVRRSGRRDRRVAPRLPRLQAPRPPDAAGGRRRLADARLRALRLPVPLADIPP